MNEAERKLTAQRARNAERIAELSNKREDWLEAARLWGLAGNKEREKECYEEANERK